MSRRRRAAKRIIKPDHLYGDVLVAMLINKVMCNGKKAVAEKIVYGAISILSEKLSCDNAAAVVALRQAITNVSPSVEVRSRRISGATYPVPVPVSSDRATQRALYWLCTFSNARKGMPMVRKLADELLDAFNNRGASFRKKEEVHRMAESNRAFAQYAY